MGYRNNMHLKILSFFSFFCLMMAADVKKEVNTEKIVANNLIILATQRFAKDMKDPKAKIFMKMALILDRNNSNVILVNHAFNKGKKIKALKKGTMDEATFIKRFENRAKYVYNLSKKNSRLQTLAFLYANVLAQFDEKSKISIIIIQRLKDEMDVDFDELLEAEMSIADLFGKAKKKKKKVVKAKTKKKFKKVGLRGMDLTLPEIHRKYGQVKKTRICPSCS
ncbi:MAG: hypothetical protein HRT89_11870, partial [Lentisphaeria bacterium]|nr:hypothetical protein [Lentisphaeria bacterium]